MIHATSLRNPVFRTDHLIRDPYVLKTAEGYELFYSRVNPDGDLMRSPQGWALARVRTKDFSSFGPEEVIAEGGYGSPGDIVFWHGRWVLPYQTYPGRSRLCYSESSDLARWSAPVEFLGEAAQLPWNTYDRVIDPTFVVDKGVLHCWFVGSCPTEAEGRHADLVGHAVTTDPDLKRWTILTPEIPLIGRSQEEHDYEGAENLTVLKAGDRWLMIYSEGLRNQHLAFATSDNLYSWDFHGRLNIPAQSWMSHTHGAPYVWEEEGRYLMALMGTDASGWTSIGLLTSPDGLDWTPLQERRDDAE